MVDTNKIRGIMAEKRKTQEDMANALHISTKTFQCRMKSGVFGSDEIEAMIDILEIENPLPIFFAKNVT